MLSGTRVSLRILPRTRPKVSSATPQPKPSLTLDPSLKSLLHDVDISLMPKHQGAQEPSTRELEALENDEGAIEYHDIGHGDYLVEEPTRSREHRKSPAARFGSDGIGTVVLSAELQHTVTAFIDGTNKTLLHSDAKRLFAEQDTSGENWSTAYNVEYKNRRQRYQHSTRDGAAFASVILPGHYSAIYAVMHHVKHRLGPSWNVDRVIDWGAATGSGLWAALNVFQKASTAPGEEALLANSTIDTYLGLDRREGLMSIAKQLLQRTELGALNATWKKTFQDEYRVDLAKGHSTIALSAFMLSAHPSPHARKNMVKEMWDSGAHTIILIDHSTPDGFQNIAEARQFLLDLGCKETDKLEMVSNPFQGSHVVAPCPHDRPCPLQHYGPQSLVCGFSQRLQRPTFVRRTKHAKQGHEDIDYSYVVVRRGPRPDSTVLSAGGRSVGRIGGVGKEAIERAKAGAGVLRELQHGHQYRHDRTNMDPQSPPSTDVNSLPADQVQAHVPVDGEAGASPADVFRPVASVDAPSFRSPRVDGRSSNKTVARLPSSPASTSTPPASAQELASTSESPRWAGYLVPEPRPESELEEEGVESPLVLEETLRSEAYEWPRLVFPPLKKSGHIIIDACTREGKIMRLTIPKSQGKQPFYDARKSSWGDVFPHPPKNKPIERFQATDEGCTSKQQSIQNVKGSDVGKRSKRRDKKVKTHERSYVALDDTLRREQKARWRASRKDSGIEQDGALRLIDSEAGSVHQY